MRRILGMGVLLAAVLVLQGGGISYADDPDVGVKRTVVTGCVHELAALGGSTDLRVRLKQTNGQMTPLAAVKGAEVKTILHTAFLANLRVTVIFQKTGPKLVARHAILRRYAPSCEKPEAPSRRAGEAELREASAADPAARSGGGCVWPEVAGEPRRPSLLLEEIRTGAASAASGTQIDPADQADILTLTQEIENLDPALVDAASWPWPYVHLRSIWGKAAFAHARPLSSPVPSLGEWTEVKLALQKLKALDTTVPDGLVMPDLGPSAWPYQEHPFPAARDLLQNVAELGVKAFEGGRIDESEFIHLLAEIDRCLDPELESHTSGHPRVCEYEWPAPYRRLLGIWGKALYAQGAAPPGDPERQAEWDEILLAIDAFPDELETPRGR